MSGNISATLSYSLQALMNALRDAKGPGSIQPPDFRSIPQSLIEPLLGRPTLWAPMATIFVDSVNGNDAFVGNTSGTAFRSLARATMSMQAGCTVNLLANSVFYETLTVPQGVTVQMSGSGTTPRVCGGVNAINSSIGWVNESGSLWYLAGVTTQPMVATFNGTLGTRFFIKTQLTASMNYCWDGLNKRLYVFAASNPNTLWTAPGVEYSQRNYPVQIVGSAVTITTLVVSHHNLDDQTIGVQSVNWAPTLTSVTGTNNAQNVVNYTLYPGRMDSTWRKFLDGSDTYLPIQMPGFNAAGVSNFCGFTGWAPSSSPQLVYAVAGNPTVNVLYNPDSWSFINSGAGLPHLGNTTANENCLVAGGTTSTGVVCPAGVGAFPSTGTLEGGVAARFYYQTNRVALNAGTQEVGLPGLNYLNPDIQNAGTTSIKIPAGVSGVGTDGALCVFQPAGTNSGWVWEGYAAIVLNTSHSGEIACGSFSLVDPGGLMDASKGGICTSLVPDWAGVIRDLEVTAGCIPHAINALLGGVWMNPSAQYPALSWDNGNASYAGQLPMGAKLAIPRSVNLGTLGLLSNTGTIVARACQDYGVIICDTGGLGLALRSEATIATNTDLNTYGSNIQNDCNLILSHLQYVAS